ncbi:MAG: SPOR domain-containing protein [Flavobacteriales bacterium]|nr:SPOR domain-containing protein [Flavobacteriales bacterium]
MSPKKGLLHFFFYCLLLPSNAFSQHNVEVHFVNPDSALAGNEIKLEAIIKCNEIISFARLQINIPEGFVPINNKKGTAQFIHSKNTIKWIWVSFGESEQRVEVTLATSKNILGEKNFESIFSFADEDSSVHLKLPPVLMYILPYVEPVAEVKPTEEVKFTTKADKYTIQIVAKREDNPIAVKNYLKQNGLKEKAFSFKENELYKFCIGRFKELEDAEIFRKKLAEKHNMKDAFVRVIPGNE